MVDLWGLSISDISVFAFLIRLILRGKLQLEGHDNSKGQGERIQSATSKMRHLWNSWPIENIEIRLLTNSGFWTQWPNSPSMKKEHCKNKWNGSFFWRNDHLTRIHTKTTWYCWYHSLEDDEEQMWDETVWFANTTSKYQWHKLMTPLAKKDLWYGLV